MYGGKAFKYLIASRWYFENEGREVSRLGIQLQNCRLKIVKMEMCLL